MEKQYTASGRQKYSLAYAAASMIVLYFVVLSGCSVEPRSGGMANPRISLKGLSGDVDEVIVTAKGKGIDEKITLTPSTEQIVLQLPAANNVRFDVEAPKKSVGDGAVYSYGGRKFVDLKVGKSSDLEFHMVPFETKLLIPDYNNFDVVQLKDLSIAELEATTPDFTSINFFLTNAPTDVEIDNQERIWIATQSELGWVSSVENTSINTVGSFLGVYALSFDRKNGYLYLIEDNDSILVHRIPVDSGGIGSPSLLFSDSTEEVPGLVQIYPFGIENDDEGFLYLTGADSGGNSYLYKINPNTKTVVKKVDGYIPDSLTGSFYAYPDIVYKHGSIFVSNQQGGKQILQFSTGLDYLGGFGERTSTPSNPGEFFRPSRFVATTAKKIYIVDDSTDSFGYEKNRIVSFTDIDGNGWETYNPLEESSGLFDRFDFFPS